MNERRIYSYFVLCLFLFVKNRGFTCCVVYNKYMCWRLYNGGLVAGVYIFWGCMGVRIINWVAWLVRRYGFGQVFWTA